MRKPGCADCAAAVTAWMGATLPETLSKAPGISNETSAAWPSFEIVF